MHQIAIDGMMVDFSAIKKDSITDSSLRANGTVKTNLVEAGRVAKQHFRMHAADHEGEVLETYETKRRDRKVALKFPRKTMKRFVNPKVIVTDRLRSYGAAMKVIGNADRQETGRWLNNRASNPSEPAFATIRHQTKPSKGLLLHDGMLHMMFKPGQSGEKNWRRLRGFDNRVKVITGVKFKDGIETKHNDQIAACSKNFKHQI
uniref:DDE-type integrase/transposase/recombinase n=1 Tax=Pararhizobium sp. IMCC3301 TaxID=3067904 RepID=UPI002740FA2A|nr:DDE-type integrase/transposase/recombinase [Pararhizobium sp. IMCC3301]